MDANPTNRTRNRRSDRYLEENAAAPSPDVQGQAAPQQPIPPTAAPTPLSRPHGPTPPGYGAAPSSPQQPQSPIRTQAQMVAQMQARTQARAQAMTQPQPYGAPNAAPARPMQAQPQAYRTPAATAVRPAQALRTPVPAPSPAAYEADEEEDERTGMPWQLTTALVLSFLLVLGLIAAQYLMMAYLKNQADEREAAHQALLDYYHVMEYPDSPSRITYQDLIEAYANANNLQPAYVAAIIRNESSFRTDAESSVGARGLMQLMPDTAEWIAHKLNVSGFSFDAMYDAETNIRFGTWYLNYLSELFRGDPVLVTAAYHAGQTTVSQWLSNRSISPDGMTIRLENLVDGPTKTYAGRVTQAYGIYQALLYPGEALEDSVVPTHSTDAPAVPTSFIER